MLSFEQPAEVNELAANRLSYRSWSRLCNQPVLSQLGLVRIHQALEMKRVSLDHRRAPFPA